MRRENVKNLQAVAEAAPRGDVMAEHGLGTVVVQARIKKELRFALRLAQGPAGEAARHFNHVPLGIAAVDAQGVKFHELATIVLIEAPPQLVWTARRSDALPGDT